MTCIVGWVENGRVTMGADAAAGVYTYCETRADPKVFQNGTFLMGYTTSFRMGQLLQHGFTPPTPNAGQDVMEFMVTKFIDAVRGRLKQGGRATKKDENEVGGRFLVGYAGRLFRIDSDYQVGEVAASYAAYGCGVELALGALYALEGMKMSPKKRVQKALEAAVEWSGFVRPPFTIITQA